MVYLIAVFVSSCFLLITASTRNIGKRRIEVSSELSEFDDYFKPIRPPDNKTLISVRKRRDIKNSIKINFINKSGREVRVYQVGFFGFFVSPRFDLRPNEPRALEVSSGTVWEVRDLDTGIYMLTNGRQRFEVRGKSSNKFLDLRIKRPYFLERKLRNFYKVPEKYLRIMVIADETVTNYHGKRKSKKLIKTIMSTVSQIFQDKSLGIKINIILTKIFLMEENQRSFRIFENDPDASIKNACSYASTLARSNRANNHNFVAIITRKSIGPSGYAAMYTMCTSRSCSIVKENGFNTAYVIAHEAGHALGIDHDGEDGDCKDDQLKGSIMAPKVYSKHERYHWSFCSKRSLYENIKYFPCLGRKVKESEKNEVDKFYELPGEISPKNDQCKEAFGIRSTGCSVYYGACEFLWCRKSIWSGCAALPLISPLEGTNCGKNKWCIKGKCIEKKVEEIAIHGNWGPWTIFGPCRGLCGAGIRRRTRNCDNPVPKRGGRTCRGKSVDIEACELEKCWPNYSKEDERNKKCQIIGKSWREYTVRMQDDSLKDANISCDFEYGSCGWLNDASDRQKWLLISGPTKSSKTGPTNDNTLGTREGAYVYFEASWINPYFKPVKGTKAKLVSQAVLLPTVCVSFHYHMYGMNMGSLKLYKMTDKGSLELLWNKEGQQGNEWFREELTINSAKKYQLVFEAIRGNGYRSDIALDDIDIVPGACISHNEPKLSSSSCKIKCISSKEQNLTEVSLEDGFPCHLDSSLDLCYQGKCLSIGCDYKINSLKKFDACGVCEGDGKSCKSVETKKIIEASKTFSEVYTIPEGSENIEIQMKKHLWLIPGILIDDDNETNVVNTDGNRWPFANYTIKDDVVVYKENADNLVFIIPKLSSVGCRVMVFNPYAAEAVSIESHAEVKVKARLPLTEGYDRFEFTVKSWTPCTKSCGGGVQHPVLACVEKNSEKILTDLYCSDIIGSGIELKRACNIQDCKQRYTWNLGAWGACSATCGLSSQARRVKCLDNAVKRIVDSANCPDPIPPKTQPCYAGPCMAHSFFTSSWGQCSKSCGKGYQTREVGCSITNQTSYKMPLISCPGTLPVSARQCHNGPCNNYKWMSRSLTQCSESCGGGLRIRMHSCYHEEKRSIVFDFLCPKPKPPSIEYCNRFDCIV